MRVDWYDFDIMNKKCDCEKCDCDNNCECSCCKS